MEMDKPHSHGNFIFFLTIYLFHLIIVVPVLYYLGTKREAAGAGIYSALLLLAVFTLLYHGIGLVDLIWNKVTKYPGMS